MPSIYFAFSAAALAGFAHLASAQTNITANVCADSSTYNSCNRNVANKWGDCVNNCNGNGNCIVDCGCTAHQEYINCMAQSCWNQVPSQTPDLLKRHTELRVRSTRASTSSSCSSTLPSAPAPSSLSPSGQLQTMPRTAAPATWARCSRTP